MKINVIKKIKKSKYPPNKSQLEAITTVEGPVMIIAGPGSGKTKTLVDRIIYLIAEKEVDPKTILVSTFTEKAAAELITRISNQLLEMEIRFNINKRRIK